MAIPRRGRVPALLSPDTADSDREFGDLLDFSEPFSWQMPPASPFVARRPRDGRISRIFRRVLREGRSSTDERAELRRFETIEESMVSSSPNPTSDPHPFTRTEGGAYNPGQEASGGYMQRDSPFSLEPSVKEEEAPSVKEEAPSVKEEAMEADVEASTQFPQFSHGFVSVTYLTEHGELTTIPDIDRFSVEERCPLLALAIEESKSGAKLHLEALTSATADAFARYLSTGSYALNSSDVDIFASVPTSLLLHCQLYRLGVIYDLPDLCSQANVNIIRQCEFGCSSPDKPIELCAAISYAYDQLAEHPAILDTIVSYCVSCFLQHRLGDDHEFRQLAYDLRPFHKDLCRNSWDRDFENETACAIIQMPFKLHKPETYASREDVNVTAYVDVVHHFHGTDDADGLNKKRKRAIDFPLPLRPHPRPVVANPFETHQDPKEEEVKSPFSDAYDIGDADTSRKRRASSVTQPSVKSEPDSEREYEMVAGPPSVEVLESSSSSDLDSECDSAEAVVVLPRAEPDLSRHQQQHNSLPIRARLAGVPSSMASTDFPAPDEASDSEWSLV